MGGKDSTGGDNSIVAPPSADLPRALHTSRLHLRRWRPSDWAPFAVLNADPHVMAYYPKPLTRDESDAFASRIQAHFEAVRFRIVGRWKSLMSRRLQGLLAWRCLHLKHTLRPVLKSAGD